MVSPELQRRSLYRIFNEDAALVTSVRRSRRQSENPNSSLTVNYLVKFGNISQSAAFLLQSESRSVNEMAIWLVHSCNVGHCVAFSIRRQCSQSQSESWSGRHMAACLVKSYSFNQSAAFRSRKATAVRILDFHSEDRNVSNRVALLVREPNDQSASHMVGQNLQR